MAPARSSPAGRIGSRVLLAAATCVGLSQPAGSQDAIFFRDTKAKELFASGRIAVAGGPGGLARLRSLALKGQSHIPASDGSTLDAAVDIRILLPDRYLRIDSGNFGRRISGYAGTTLLNRVEGPTGTVSPRPDDAGVLEADRADLARLMLGMFTYVSEEVPLTLQTRETLVEMPGTADPLGIDAVGTRGFSARVVFDARTRVPSRLVFWGPARSVLTMSFLDRRPTGGLRAPFQITTADAGRMLDSMTFDQVTVNPPIDKRDLTR
jgi:hypothetical protein